MNINEQSGVLTVSRRFFQQFFCQYRPERNLDRRMRNLMDLAELDKAMPERSAINDQQVIVLIKTVYNDRLHRARSGARQHDHFSVLITVRQFFQAVHAIENHI